MSTAAVILAGGRGTRSADPSIPKIAQQVGGKSLLQWHLDLIDGSGIDEVLIVTGHLGDEVARLLETADTHHIPVRIVHETQPRGTVPALQLAASESTADRLLVILGDVWCSFPVNHFLVAWEESELEAAAIVHPSLHPADSDAVIPSPDGSVTVISKSKRIFTTGAAPHRNMSAAGVFAVARSTIIESDATDVGSELIADAAQRDQLLAYVSSHYLKDTGTPDRLEKAHDDWCSGAFAARGMRSPRAALFLDRDGVLNPALPEVYRPESLTLLPGVATQIARANAAGVPVVVVTNQPGLAKGFMTFADHEAIRGRLDELLIAEGAFVDDYSFCPHHPETGFDGEVADLKIACACRKPEPGMLLDLIGHHTLEPSMSVLVGDSDRDEGAAQAAGVRFIRATDTHPAASAIEQALTEIMLEQRAGTPQEPGC